MNAKAFKVIDAINRDGLDNQFWGLVKDVDDTKTYFGSNEGCKLVGAWAYVYNDPKNDHTFLSEIEPDMVIWDRFGQAIYLYKL